MRLWFAFFLLSTTALFAEVGKVTKIVGATDAYLMRESNKLALSPDLLLELNDEIFAENAYVVIHLYPGTQMSLAKNSQVKISEHMIEEADDLEKSSSVIDFIKGIIRLQVTKDANQQIEQKVQAKDVAFAVRGTEFEVSLEDSSDVDLDVFEGEVEVSSPHVHTFVPEIVKANEGFRFDRKNRNFSRRRFAPKFRNHPGFENAKRLREEWKAIKKQRRAERADKKSHKMKLKEQKRSDRMRNHKRSRRKGSGN